MVVVEARYPRLGFEVRARGGHDAHISYFSIRSQRRLGDVKSIESQHAMKGVSQFVPQICSRAEGGIDCCVDQGGVKEDTGLFGEWKDGLDVVVETFEFRVW